MIGVFIKTYSEPQFNKKEILRYSGCREADNKIEKLIEACIEECRGRLTYKMCYSKLSLPDEFFEIESNTLKKNLDGCHEAVVFAGTVGIEIDRLISKHGKVSPLKALIFQAIGAERIEALCDLFCAEFEEAAKEKGEFVRRRFSAGYGDFPLEFQKNIFKLLDCSKKVGISLNESMIMSPSKSVTAIFGISKEREECKNHCDDCEKEDCSFREKVK